MQLTPEEKSLIASLRNLDHNSFVDVILGIEHEAEMTLALSKNSDTPDILVTQHQNVKAFARSLRDAKASKINTEEGR